jgi:hypothetical protein
LAKDAAAVTASSLRIGSCRGSCEAVWKSSRIVTPATVDGS